VDDPRPREGSPVDAPQWQDRVADRRATEPVGDHRVDDVLDVVPLDFAQPLAAE